MAKDIQVFKGSGLNKDDELDLMQAGDSRNRDNLGFIDGNFDSLIPRRVKLLVYRLLPGGRNKVIGVCDDKENGAAIYFVYNNYSNHCILRIYADDTTEDISYSESFWNFQENSLIFNAKVIGQGDNAMLSWTDNYNPPRLVNIAKLVSSYYSTIDEAVANAQKPAPTDKPSLVLGTDATITINKLRGKVYQFAYRYVYDTGQKSTMSHWSDVVFDTELEFTDGVYTSDEAVNNKITVSMAVDWDNVTNLELFARNTDVGSGAPGYWMKVADIAVTLSTETYVFTGSEQGVVIDDATFNRLSDQVPLTARTQEFINGNRLAYGGFNRGRDKIDLNVTLGTSSTTNGLPDAYVASPSVGNVIDTANATFTLDLAVSGETHVTVVFVTYEDLVGPSERAVYSIRSNLDQTATETCNALRDKINDLNTIGITAANNSDDLQITYNKTGTETRVYVALFSTEVREKVWAMKANSTAKFAIAYYDLYNREGRCQISEDTSIYISESDTQYAVPVRRLVSYSISHTAPSWATHWQWLYGGTTVTDMFQVIVSSFKLDATAAAATADDPDMVKVGGLIKIDLDAALERIEDEGTQTIQTFTPVVGDIVNVKGYINTNTSAEYVDNEVIFNLPIREIDVDGYIYIDDFTREGEEWDIDEYVAYLLEFTRERSIEDVIVYREVGDLLEVTESGGVYYHNTSTVSGYTAAVDQSSGVPGTGVINFGDCYQYINYWWTKVMWNQIQYEPTPVSSRIESFSSSLTYDSEANGSGRLNYVDDDESNKDYNAIVYGGTFNDTSLNYNELNKFDVGSEKFLNDKYGDIYSLVEMGYTLYCIQKSKVTPFDLGRSTIEQDGQIMTVSTNVVIGSDRPFDQDFGTIYGGSVTKYDRSIYFFDSNDASLYRLSQNGLTDLSILKMKTFFRDLSASIRTYGETNYEFRSFYDIRTQSYVLSATNVLNASLGFSISFHTVTGKWMCTENYYEDGMVSISGHKVYSFTYGRVYKHHDENAAFEEAYLDVHFTNPPLQNKRFQGIEIDGLYQWSTSDDPSVWVDEDEVAYQDSETYVRYNGAQQSLIPNGNYKKINGKWVAAFLRNKLNRDGTDGGIKLYQGDRLAGKHLTVRLTNTETTNENRLKAVVVEYMKS